jgi:hypothetical protein
MVGGGMSGDGAWRTISAQVQVARTPGAGAAAAGAKGRGKASAGKKRRVQHAGQADIVDETADAAQQRGILHAPGAAAENTGGHRSLRNPVPSLSAASPRPY